MEILLFEERSGHVGFEYSQFKLLSEEVKGSENQGKTNSTLRNFPPFKIIS